jgi:hypothetical protein
MSTGIKTDKILTVRVHHENLDPRTFRIPVLWITWATWLAWILVSLTVISSVYAIREYLSERSARPELVSELENEIQNLKIALEKKVTPQSTTPGTPTASNSTHPTDSNAVNEKPPANPGAPIAGKDGVWFGFADQIKPPPTGQNAPISLEDARVDWQGKYAMFTANVAYRDPGRGSQQGHLIVLGRSNDRIYAHPDGVLNTTSNTALFDPNRGEYFSVSHFRILKAGIGPFDSQDLLKEVQVFAFDINNRLILLQTFKYGK